MNYKFKVHAAIGALTILASAAFAQTAEQGPPCTADPNSADCKACTAELAGDMETAVLICGISAELTSICAMSSCSGDLRVYEQCIAISHAYSAAGDLERLKARTSELASRSLTFEQVCAPSALPALQRDAEQQISIYGVFNIETKKAWNECLIEMGNAAAEIVDDANLRNNSRGSSNLGIRSAEAVVDRIPWIIGRSDVDQTFVVGENLASITTIIQQNTAECSN